MPKRPRGERVLHYKVMELSTVDEQSLERGINQGVAQGWRFDGMQFAMRESSKRPAMAFLVFTRLSPEGVAAQRPEGGATTLARKRLERLAHGPDAGRRGRVSVSADQRLRELAGLDGATEEENE